jgi:UDP-N-acetyl-D-galactosamine dehydrogenase
MNLFKKIKDKQEKIAVIGLGYVGMPLAIAFAKKADVIGFDINEYRIEKYRAGIDITHEVGGKALKETTCLFTNDETAIRNAKFIIIAVPTPIAADKTPDLFPVEAASKTVGRNLTHGAIVVYESTVYPGVTEDICIPILEKESGLKCGIDFKVGYSPERINPGDKLHRIDNITKIVSGIDEESLNEIAAVYEMVVEVGVHKASSIKVAEAAKVVENSQRDINIAFMNELAMVFNRMNVDTNEVIEAMNTKWNALKFYPGLVGGHCIGVDPYYFIYKAEQLGYHSQIILSGRKINDDMGLFIADNIIKKMIFADKKIKGSKVTILGVTFKENCPDVRNSKVIDIINVLKEYDIDVFVCDPVADKQETFDEYGIELVPFKNLPKVDCIVCAVRHRQFKEIDLDILSYYFKDSMKILIDVKSMFSKKSALEKGFLYWNL